VIGLNLDEVRPIAREITTDKTSEDVSKRLGAPYFRATSITLGAYEQHIFSLVAFTRKYHCTWYIKLSVSFNGRTKDITIGLPGENFTKDQPFQITAPAYRGIRGKGDFSAYGELYIWNGQPVAGFVKQDPKTYAG
jgi:hypothetical protein